MPYTVDNISTKMNRNYFLLVALKDYLLKVFDAIITVYVSYICIQTHINLTVHVNGNTIAYILKQIIENFLLSFKILTYAYISTAKIRVYLYLTVCKLNNRLTRFKGNKINFSYKIIILMQVNQI